MSEMRAREQSCFIAEKQPLKTQECRSCPETACSLKKGKDEENKTCMPQCASLRPYVCTLVCSVPLAPPVRAPSLECRWWALLERPDTLSYPGADAI